MRFAALGISLVLLLQAGAALAASGKEGSGKGSSSGSSSSGSSQSGGGFGGVEGRPEERDIVTGQMVKDKAWEVGAEYEHHSLLIQNPIDEGVATNKNLEYTTIYARYDITKNDRITLRGGFFAYALADQGETGLRFDDALLSYTRYVHLPADITARALVWVTAPLSYDSQKASLITAPRLSIGVERPFFKYIDLDARVTGDLFITKYSTYAGGQPNERAHLGLSGGILITAPFHTALQVGFSVATGYNWYYDVGTPPPGSPVGGATADKTYVHQPILQTYGGEVYVRYNFPAVYGIKSDFSLALAQGDPELGYASVLHDGAAHVYGLFRNNGEVYGTIAARY